MNDKFKKADRFVLSWERGFVSDPDDKGGATFNGISSTANPDIDVHKLSELQAREIRYKRYWCAVSGDALPYPVDLAVYDFAIHSGANRSVSMLQRIIGTAPDGRIGPKTLTAIAAWDSVKLATALVDLREKFLIGLVHTDPTQQKFLRGWLNRLNALRKALGE